MDNKKFVIVLLTDIHMLDSDWRIGGVTENVMTLDVSMYVPVCETGHLYHIKKNDFAK